MNAHRVIRRVFPFLLILPAIGMLIALTIFPVAWSLFTSLKRMTLLDLMTQGGRYAGLKNYVTLLKDALFWNALKNSCLFVGVSVCGQVACGLLLASILRNTSIKGRAIFRAIFLIPWITTSVIAAYSWIYILDTNLGFLPALSYKSSLLRFVGLGRRDWLTNPASVIYVLALINIWKGTGFSILLQSAGLQSIPASLYESAEVDGAGMLHTFFFITIPLLLPFILVNFVMTTMITFNVYDLILLITGGGPGHRSEVLSLFVYNTGFVQGDLGYAAALSLVLLFINLTVTMLYLIILRSRDTN